MRKSDCSRSVSTLCGYKQNWKREWKRDAVRLSDRIYLYSCLICSCRARSSTRRHRMALNSLPIPNPDSIYFPSMQNFLSFFQHFVPINKFFISRQEQSFDHPFHWWRHQSNAFQSTVAFHSSRCNHAIARHRNGSKAALHCPYRLSSIGANSSALCMHEAWAMPMHDAGSISLIVPISINLCKI